jgi:4-alpha-glucanotransferase
MSGKEEANYKDRLKAYLVKALREGKKNSNWTSPNEEYENSVKTFIDRLLESEGLFLKSFLPFHRRAVDFGIVNSLSKVVLKFTCPGVPDVYQGCELWDLSMVDPDNRRAVDYDKRNEALEKIISNNKIEHSELVETLWQDRFEGAIKLWFTHLLLKERDLNPVLFAEGHYYPLKVKGKYKDHIHAFARRLKEDWMVTIIPLNLASLSQEQQSDIHSIDWRKTRVVLPDEAPVDWEDVILKRKGKLGKGIYIKDLFQTLPIGLLKLKAKVTDRGAGVLMHITSLPSKFGVGDFGPDARRFADFLSTSRQKYWQLLPITQTEAGNGHSPYSSISSMAGNTLLISPELLVEEGLLQKEDYEQLVLPSRAEVDYSEAEKIKNSLFEIAYRNFLNQSSSHLHYQFKLFCEQESDWLNDYSLYVTLKQEHGGKGWFDWKEEFKLRKPEALDEFSKDHQDQIQKVKWLQFVFSRQWKALRTYCNNLNIKMFGDLPFYVSYDSVDVWSHPEIFSLDADGKLVGVAGVPPDYFNADGQLWGMPVFKWDVLKQQNYNWWIKRLKKNIELFDLVRLDHFRAFADFWEVPANEKTAKNGCWKLGPGSDFFKMVKEQLGSLPFIAEDLGEITDIVVQLREEFQLPGMKILQFAFGDEMPSSIFIPHNYNSNFVAYTGTHDNNTSIGWYRQNTSKIERKNLERYVGGKVKEKEVSQVLARMAYSSVAKIVILPIQDILGLDESGRMNVPASTEKNWLWRLKPNQLTEDNKERLRDWVEVFGRG